MALLCVNPLNYCQCCQEEQKDDEDIYVDVDEKWEIKFVEVLGIPINFLKVCLKCHSKVEDFFAFKKEILGKQIRSVYLIDDALKPDKREVEVICPLSSVKVEYSIEPETNDSLKLPKIKKHRKPVRSQSSKQIKELSKSCPICLKNFKNRRTIKDHIMRIHDKNKKSISCDRCPYSCYTKFEIQNHVKKQHLPRVEDPSILRVCPYCAKVMKGNNHLNSHIKMKHLKVIKFICDKCPFTTHGAYEIRRHMEIHHLPLSSRKNFPCNFEGCKAVLTTAASLTIHKKLKHERQKNHACSLCDKRFALERLVTSHIQNVHLGVRPFPCSFNDCDKRFVNKNQLNNHVKRVHMGLKEEVPPCHVCGKVLTTKNHLQGHMKFHREPAFSCSFCEKKFFDKSKRNSHQDTAHLGKTFDCEYCAKKFQSLRGWQRHVSSIHMNKATNISSKTHI